MRCRLLPTADVPSQLNGDDLRRRQAELKTALDDMRTQRDTWQAMAQARNRSFINEVHAARGSLL